MISSNWPDGILVSGCLSGVKKKSGSDSNENLVINNVISEKSSEKLSWNTEEKNDAIENVSNNTQDNNPNVNEEMDSSTHNEPSDRTNGN